MITIDILTECRNSGLCVEVVEGEYLSIEPADKLEPKMLEQLRRHKQRIIQVLSLSAMQKKALYCWYRQLAKKRKNLASKGYDPVRAKVKRSEFKEGLMVQLGLSLHEVNEIESSLIQNNLLAVDSTWLIAT